VVTVRLVDVTERGEAWAAPDRPAAGPPSYASDWPQAPSGRPPLPQPPVRRPSPPRITLPPNVLPPYAAPPVALRPSPPPWPGAVRAPGGLIPAGPPRPIYREPGPARFGPIAAGAGAAALWMLLFGLLASTARSYAWLTFTAGLLAWLSALVLGWFGDRGVAVGVAVSTAVGVAIAGIVVTVQWSAGHWLLW
jgi:hypothetical protein